MFVCRNWTNGHWSVELFRIFHHFSLLSVDMKAGHPAEPSRGGASCQTATHVTLLLFTFRSPQSHHINTTRINLSDQRLQITFAYISQTTFYFLKKICRCNNPYYIDCHAMSLHVMGY